MAAYALLLHGKLGDWRLSATETPAPAHPNATSARQRSFARFTHASLWRHAVLATRRLAPLAVVVHSWNPELRALLDGAYAPNASAHEPALPLDKVASQHASLRRALAMLRQLPGARPALVMVARLDLLLFSDVALPLLPATPHSLYLPHHCVSARVRLPSALAALEGRVRRRACSGQPTARRLVPPQLSRYASKGSRRLERQDDFRLFVLDYFFIASYPVALSFGEIAPKLDEYREAIRRHVRGQFFPWWSHVVWSWHIRTVLAARGVRPRFILQHEVDFTLARFWRYGSDCIVPVPSVNPAADLAFRDATQIVSLQLGANGTSFVYPQLEGDILKDQCPSPMVEGTLVAPLHLRAKWAVPVLVVASAVLLAELARACTGIWVRSSPSLRVESNGGGAHLFTPGESWQEELHRHFPAARRIGLWDADGVERTWSELVDGESRSGGPLPVAEEVYNRTLYAVVDEYPFVWPMRENDEPRLIELGDERPVRLHALSSRPRVLVADAVLSAEECEVVQRMAMPRMQERLLSKSSCLIRSLLSAHHSCVWHRKASSTHRVLQQWRVGNGIRIRRLAALARVHLDGAENMQVIHYQIDEHFHYHSDSIGSPQVEGRALTALVYLNDGFEACALSSTVDLAIHNVQHVRERYGGCTTQEGLSVTPTRGSVLLFYNLLPNSAVMDYFSWHGSCDVRHGEKWAANFWFRLDMMRRMYNLTGVRPQINGRSWIRVT
ncbi:hypothetical protein AB1Y20_001056 [Prymnesium parvum]|uniref:Fe2OG dioxygenase domain-containing protein n=1 Tax=Prymnesium parvum TaxID=97485 RepID=A0AB34KCG1_PRYPA